MINGVVRQLESQTDGDIPTERIGELVMEGLKTLDDVAYVRFASVYRNFREARDFNAIVGELEAEPEAKPARPKKFPPATERARYMSQSAGADPLGSAPDGGGAQSGIALARSRPPIRPSARSWSRRRIVGRGATAPGGRPHAERIAIAEAGEAARGATLYVTLEPCSHFGVSPPCVDAIIAAGVARVVSAMEDPDALVAGRGWRA